MADSDREFEFVGQFLQFDFPQPHPIAVEALAKSSPIGAVRRRAAWNAHGDLGELALLTIIGKDSVISLSRTIHG
jgi:hypothetical protein